VPPPNERRDMMRWSVAPMKRVELKKSINLPQIEGSFANIEITDILGIAPSTIVIEASAAPSSGAITHG
jgi:hypothetical protein